MLVSIKMKISSLYAVRRAQDEISPTSSYPFADENFHQLFRPETKNACAEPHSVADLKCTRIRVK